MEDFNSSYGNVQISYKNSKIVISFDAEQQEKLGRAEAELIMQEYVDNLGENAEVGAAYETQKGYYAAQVLD